MFTQGKKSFHSLAPRQQHVYYISVQPATSTVPALTLAKAKVVVGPPSREPKTRFVIGFLLWISVTCKASRLPSSQQGCGCEPCPAKVRFYPCCCAPCFVSRMYRFSAPPGPAGRLTRYTRVLSTQVRASKPKPVSGNRSSR